MTNTLFSIFIAVALLRGLKTWRTWLWVGLSVLAFAQVGQKMVPGVLGLLLIQALVVFLIRRVPRLNTPFLPLVYAAVLLVLNAKLHLNLPGFSYIVLSSSLDLGATVKWSERAFNLLSFPKIVVGPIAGAESLRPKERETSEIYRVAFFGILKAFILVNLWRTYFATPEWAGLSSPTQYLWFGLWNYVNLFLEFSGTCDLVAASFWLFGYNCPLNFDRPYLALSVGEFWKRWHITLSHWIKNFVYIPMGGSRVVQWRILLNLMLAMCLSGLWHGLSANYLTWGALQGLFLCIERQTGHESRIARSSRPVRGLYWLITQLLVTLSWVAFFAKF